MTALQVFTYEDNGFSFRDESGVIYINATEMAKPFGKRPGNWLNTQYAKTFIKTYSAVRKRVATDLVIVRNGGDNYGTWMHEDIAREFAQWSSVVFRVMCTQKLNAG